MTGVMRSPVVAMRVGAIIVTGLLVLAVGAGWFAPYDPRLQTGPPFASPSSAHWLGTNDVGQDILSELIYGSRVSLGIGVMAALIALGAGAVLGVVAGYCKGRIDAIVMAAVDVALTLPFLPLMILVAAYLGPSPGTLVGVIGLVTWARPARIIRAQTLALGRRDDVLAVRALGARHRWILWRHLLPAVAPLALAQFVLAAGNAIALEAGLSFLGLGDPTRNSWGTTLFYAQARNAFLSGSWPWWVLPPGLLIALSVSGFALLGVAADPARHGR